MAGEKLSSCSEYLKLLDDALVVWRHQKNVTRLGWNRIIGTGTEGTNLTACYVR